MLCSCQQVGCCVSQVLDVGACGSLWNLPRSLLRCEALEQLVVPSRAIGHHVIEQLELRGRRPVEVVIEPPEGQTSDDHFSDGEYGESEWSDDDDWA